MQEIIELILEDLIETGNSEGIYEEITSKDIVEMARNIVENEEFNDYLDSLMFEQLNKFKKKGIEDYE